MTEPVKAAIKTFKIVVGRCRDLSCTVAAQYKPCKFPCLSKLLPTNLQSSTTFVHLSLTLSMGPGFGFYPENSKGFGPT